MNLIDEHIMNRSARAIRCLSLNSDFYEKVKVCGLTATDVLNMEDRYITNVFYKLRDTKEIENTFLKLIKIGILRREVDGQGLTSKVRLTPLGRLLVDKEPRLADKSASLFELFSNWFFMNVLLK